MATLERPAGGRFEGTPARILDAAWDLIRERGGVHDVRVADVAAAAGVSRQLVYLHFENRTGLLEAMTRRHDEVSGFSDRVGVAACLPPVEALERLIRDWLAYLPDIYPVASALEAARANDDAGAAVYRQRMGDIRGAFRFFVDAIATAGALAEGWTVERATDWAWGQAHLTAWQHMVVERGWTQEDYVERCVRSIMGELVRPNRSREAG